MSKVDEKMKLRKIQGTEKDEYGRTWMDVVSDVWAGTYGEEN